ncbi:MAG: tRNA (adenosine(37)-N6)-threonylcarbamoyltransferase complex dimerization subunit type 1 TsaB [Chloroflexi bacterium]|nr:tRNA (adenosine(37)-N6)-threonylcarbamoyltransferase complex dimerization subunit type 1 TsaB [Chloroflexota bacterium]
MLLAIDTATQLLSLALYDGLMVLAEKSWWAGRHHTVELMPNLIHLLDQAGVGRTDIRALGVARGPGSFTGLRIGLSATKGLAAALDIPIVAIPTLSILAYPHFDQPLPICPVIQAGRGRLCFATFHQVIGQWRQTSDFQLAVPAHLAQQVRERTLFCGELDQPTIEALQKGTRGKVVIARPAASLRRAGYLAELAWDRWKRGDTDKLATLTPIYIQLRQK